MAEKKVDDIKCTEYQCEVYGFDDCPHLNRCDPDCPHYDGNCDTCIFQMFDGACGRNLYDDENCW